MERRQQDTNPLEIDHVAIVVRDMEKAIRQLCSLWNVGPFQIREIELADAMVHGKQTRVRLKVAHAQAGPVELELIEPGEGENIYWEFLRAKGEGVHHLGVHVSDIRSELAGFKKRGIEVLQSGNTPRHSLAYIDTEGIAGVIVELMQRKQSPA